MLTLKKGSRKLDILVKVENTARDHRLRVMYDTGIKMETACSAGHSYVNRRPILPKDCDGEHYSPEMQTLPMQSFVDIILEVCK